MVYHLHMQSYLLGTFTEYPSLNVFQKLTLFQRFPIIHISRSKHEIEDFTFDYQM